MSNSADFEAKLRDSMSGPAKKIAGALNKMRSSASDLQAKMRAAKASLGGFAKKARSARAGTTKFGGSMFGSMVKANLFSAALSSVFTGFTSLVGGAISGMARLTASFVRATGAAANFGQKSKLSFARVMGSAKAGDAELKKIQDTAKRYGLDVFDTTTAYQKLLSKQFKPKAAMDIIKMTTDLRTMGATADEAKRTVTAIGQIKTTGKLQGDELMQLADAGVDVGRIYDELGKSMGKTRDEVMKLKEGGKINADTAIKAIGEAIKKQTKSKDFGDAGKQFADSTMEGMAGQLKARGQIMLLEFSASLVPSMMSLGATVGAAFDSLTQNQTVQEFSEKLQGLFEIVIDSVNKAMPGIENFVQSFATAAAPGLDSIGDALADIDWDMFNDGVSTAGTVLGTVVSIMGAWIGASIKGAEAFFTVLGAVGHVATGVTGFMGHIRDVVVGNLMALQMSLTMIGAQVVDGFTKGFTSKITAAVTAAKSLASQVKGAVTTALEIKSPSRVFADLGGHTAEGFEQGLTGRAPNVVRATSDMFESSAKLSGKPGARAGTAGGSQTNSVVVNVDMAGYDGDASDFASRVGAEIERKLQSYALQMGAT